MVKLVEPNLSPANDNPALSPSPPPEYDRVIVVKTNAPVACAPERPGNAVGLELSKMPLTSFRRRRERGLMLADFKIQNLNAFSVANIVVRCTYAIQTVSSYTSKRMSRS
jgi:hypothetical protein